MIKDCLLLGFYILTLSASYARYKFNEEAIKNILKAPRIEVGPDLQKLLDERDNKIEYAVVSGKVHPMGKSIESENQTGLQGVMQVVTLKERSETFANGKWYNSNRTLKTTKNAVPFALTSLDHVDHVWRRMLVEIKKPFAANTEKLLHPVSTFKPPSLELYHLSGYLNGVKRVETQEDFLPVETVITAIGQVSRDSKGCITLREPKLTYTFPYILSKQSPDSIIKRLEDKKATDKFWTYILWGLGILIIIEIYREWLEPPPVRLHDEDF